MPFRGYMPSKALPDSSFSFYGRFALPLRVGLRTCANDCGICCVPISATRTSSTCRTLDSLTSHRYHSSLVLQALQTLPRGFLPPTADGISPGGFRALSSLP